MKKQNNIEELFRDKLQNIEADPGINAWANVQAGMSAAPAAVASASSWVSTAIVAATITAVAVGGYFFFNKEGEKKTKNIEAPIIQSIDLEKEEVTNPIDENSVIIEADQTERAVSTDKEASVVIEKPEKPITKSSDENTLPKTNATKEPVSSSEISEKMIDEIIAKHQESLNLDGHAMDNETSSATQEEQKEEQGSKASHANSSAERKAVLPVTDAQESNNGLSEKEQNKLITDQVIFPNVFSPGNDGKNDIFVLDVVNSIQIDNIKVSIYDKTNKLVNEWSGLYNGWDGKYKDGRMAAKDSYIYKAIILKDNKEYLKVNSFTLY